MTHGGTGKANLLIIQKIITGKTLARICWLSLMQLEQSDLLQVEIQWDVRHQFAQRYNPQRG
jgi:hypothetical protein